MPFRTAQHDEAAEVALVHQINRRRAIARGQHAVVCGRGAAALGVAQVHAACFVAGLLLDQLRDRLPDASQPLVTEGVQFGPLRRLAAIRQLCAFGDHDDGKLLPVIVTVL